jgi:hypothetical protein
MGFAVAVGEWLAVFPEVVQFIDQMTHGFSPLSLRFLSVCRIVVLMQLRFETIVCGKNGNICVVTTS